MNHDSSRSMFDGIGRFLSRLGMVAGLYVLAGLAALGMYVAALLLTATAAQRAWGWPGMWAVVAGFMGLTALLALLAALLVQRSDRREAGHSVQHRDTEAMEHAYASCEEGELEGDDGDESGSITQTLADMLGYRSRKEVWIDAASVLLAVVAVLGPFKVARLGARVLARGVTVRSLMRAILSSRR